MTMFANHCLQPVSYLRKARQRTVKRCISSPRVGGEADKLAQKCVRAQVFKEDVDIITESRRQARKFTVKSLRMPRPIILPSQLNGAKRPTLSEQLQSIASSVSSFTHSLESTGTSQLTKQTAPLLEAKTVRLVVGRCERTHCEYLFEHPYEKTIEMTMYYEHMRDTRIEKSTGVKTGKMFTYRLEGALEWYVHDYDAKDKTQQLELHFMYDADARRFETSVLPIIRQYYQQS